MTKAIRQIRIEGNIAYVPLTQGYEAIIDAGDVGLVNGRNWSAELSFRSDGTVRAVYAARREWVNGIQFSIKMHRLISEAGHGAVVDHVDGDGLNNRRENVRLASVSQNNQNRKMRADNTSGFKGVTWCGDKRKWHARIWLDGRKYNLGKFASVEAAAAAYAKASVQMHGEFGRTA